MTTETYVAALQAAGFEDVRAEQAGQTHTNFLASKDGRTTSLMMRVPYPHEPKALANMFLKLASSPMPGQGAAE
jgi:hypothetical protein